VPGDRVATLAWNNFRHFEIEHGVTGLGAVWHAINPRLISSQEDDWFNTGDLAVMDGNNYIQLTDRAKDVIKSGGEWISSIDVENLAAGCPGVAEAAVIGIPHPKWEERPLLVVVPAAGATVTARSIAAHLEGKIAKWWMPDDVVFVDALSYGATGKIQKMELRRRFAGHYSSPARSTA
jgi:fatty-acyl-CoA synthase